MNEIMYNYGYEFALFNSYVRVRPTWLEYHGEREKGEGTGREEV